MKKFLTLFLLGFFLTIFSSQVFAQNTYAPRSVRVITLSPEEDESKDFYTLWGEVIEIKGNVTGDIYAAGQKIIVEGIVNGDVLAVAGEIIIEGEIKGNLRTISESTVILGNVEKNVTLISGFVNILPDSKIKGGLIAISEESNVLSTVEGQIKLIGERARIDAFVGSDTEAWVHNLDIGSEAKLSDITYYSQNFANVNDQASISGRLQRSQNRLFGDDINVSKFRDSMSSYANKGRIFLHIMSLFWAFIWGALILRFYPKYLKTVNSVLDKKLLKSGLLGLALLILTPLSIFLLLITLVGIPFSLFLIFVFSILSYLSKVSVSFWIGRKLIKNNTKTYLALGVGTLIYYLLTYVQIFGFLISFTVLIFGLGSGVFAAREMYFDLKKKNLV